MKILLISDIHANPDGLNAVLDAEALRCRGVICLGDITGYGPDPEDCVRIARNFPSQFESCVVLGGNHDAALSGKLPLEWFNAHARASVEKSKRLLSPESLEWLSSLPSSASIEPGVFASHGSPLEPLTGYLWGDTETDRALSWLAARDLFLCFCGHTHEAAVFSGASAAPMAHGKSVAPGKSVRNPVPGEVVMVPAGTDARTPLIINPGSTGFPRSFNGPRVEDLGADTEPISASSFPAYYAVWDTAEHAVSFGAARYDRRPVEERILKKT